MFACVDVQATIQCVCAVIHMHLIEAAREGRIPHRDFKLFEERIDRDRDRDRDRDDYSYFNSHDYRGNDNNNGYGNGNGNGNRSGNYYNQQTSSNHEVLQVRIIRPLC